ncbi:MAG: flavodoxin-dependent (E)-4-hydroxy-3-methylbut-2-enyl-diphosphate synthase, partial [Opitutaceae bacterium]|nr:flavodoxin-dependent (E)-4-hydroxy-3-methylbut-2-enyl-diphosphate synthase [Opitutaceae bacterium]
YDAELQRLHDAFSPLVKRCRALGRAMRIGTNHGSLSDRIMNRYGDSPLGMVESALEFLRIAESHDYRQIILSMKSSNPKVMIQAYRLLVERMAQENMHYPLHLGVTEAGDGEDGRIKGAIGIGSLLLDGLGDTIRVSLTEDSVYEIPVARASAEKAMSQWRPETGNRIPETDGIDPYHFTRRETPVLLLAPDLAVGPEQPPRVITRVTLADLADPQSAIRDPKLRDTPAEGLLVAINSNGDLATLGAAIAQPALPAHFLALELAAALTPDILQPLLAMSRSRVMLVRSFEAGEATTLEWFAGLVRRHGHFLACDMDAAAVGALADTLRRLGDNRLFFTLSGFRVPVSGIEGHHALGAYRRLAAALGTLGLRPPLWIRNTAATATRADNSYLSKLLEASFLTGALLCDGLGDCVSLETEADPVRATRLAYNVLQGAGARISKTEFVACPSCGRTLFDLQSTTQRIREKTGHLKGVKLAIMGCIVNGPGEMADADFGYVGGAPGKINLYAGKQCVQYNIPQAEADARLIALIKEHGKWTDPEPVHA